MAPAELQNAAIADALQELGDLYELDGAVVHRVHAYRNAAKSVRSSPLSVAALARAGRASELPNVGKTIEAKIIALLDDGAIPAAERLRQRFPPGLVAITKLRGIGGKRARLLYEELGIDSPEKLRAAATAQQLRTVRGLGPAFERRVLEALESPQASAQHAKLLLPAAIDLADALARGLLACGPSDARIEIAGSIRRGADSVRDIDLVAITSDPASITAALQELEEIESVQSGGSAAAKARTHSGVFVELRAAPPERYGNLLQHFTGSAAHNAAVRQGALRRGIHVSEHGIVADGRARLCATEQEVYETLGFAWIPPELREDRGELAAAAQGAHGLPALLAEADLRGDLHCHSRTSDGIASIEEMAAAARARGYEYLAITDHSATHGFGNDVTPDALRRQIEHIRALNAGEPGSEPGLRLLAGSEVNILPDGSLDYDDELLRELDWVVASVHTAFRSSSSDMTKRIIAALEHPLVDALGHPTGRLIERRQPYSFDIAAVIDAAARTGTMLEINGNPNRRDLSDVNARAAAERGVKLVIDSDAHRPSTLPAIHWGVLTARRAWLSKHDVANTLTWPQLRRLRKRERGGLR